MGLNYKAIVSTPGRKTKPRSSLEGVTKYPPGKLPKDAFMNWMTLHSDDHTIITPLYEHLDETEAILADSWTKGQRQYLVQWKPTPSRDRHIKLHEARGYKVADTTQFHGDDRIRFDEEASLVFWKPKWECAENFTHPSNPSQARMAEAFEEAKASRPALKLAAATSRR